MRSLIGGVLNRAPVSFAPTRRSFTSPTASGGGAAAQMAAMGSVGTLFAIVARLANATSQTDWHLYRKAAPGTPPEHRVEVTRHAALEVWSRPNQFHTRQELVETVQQHLDLTGEGWPVIARAGRLPIELWPVRPDRITPVPSPTDYLSGYIYTSPDGEKVPLELADVIQLRSPNPLDPYRGMGPVQSILADLDSARFGAEWNRNFFINGAAPGGILKVDKRLSDDEFTELTSRWREQHQGVAQAHRVAIIEQGEWIERNYSMKDMQFGELRNVSREIIREAFSFPKPMLGATDDVNRANSEAAEVQLARWCIIPRLERWKGALNNDFLPQFGPTAAGLEFDYDSPVPEDAELEQTERTSKATAFSTLVTAGVDPVWAAKTVGLPDDIVMVAPAAPAAGDPAAGAGQGGPSELIDTTGQDRQDDVDWGLFGGDSDDDTTEPATNFYAGWDPGKHPRDRKGRFTASRTSKLTDAERDMARGVISGFKPKQFADSASADAYVMGGPKLPQEQIDAVDSYSGDSFLETNRQLRAGGDVSGDTTVKNLRAAMRPTEDDLILTRTVGFDAFPKGMKLEDLAGMKVKDAAFSSTSLGAAYGGSLGNVRMKIAVPAGTPAVFAAKYSRNPNEREIILGDGLEFAVASVTKNDQYGYDISLIVLPKGKATSQAIVNDMIMALAVPDAPVTRPTGVVAPPPAPTPPAGIPQTLPPEAGPDLTPVQDAWEAALVAAVAVWLTHALGDEDARTRAPWGVAGVSGDLVRQVRDAVHAHDLLALTRLTVDTAAAGDALGARVVEVAEAAARHVVTEAALQGVSISTGPVDRAALQATGQLAAATLGDGLRISAAREAARVWGPGVDADTVAIAVADHLADLTPAQPEQVVGGALTGGQAAGREATVLAGPSAALYARETLDRNTCLFCREVDGRWIGNSDDPLRPWRAMYPVRGYVSCLGGDRCRGMIVAVWRGGKDWTQWIEKEPVTPGEDT